MLISDLREATRSVSRVVMLQRDLTLANAELKAIIQAKRIACAIAGLALLQIALGLGLLWVGIILFQAGHSAGLIAALSFLIPASIAAVFFVLVDRIGKAKRPQHPSQSNSTSPTLSRRAA
jgi:membrane protein implicated in regulation of membrane protease activity